MERRVPGDPDHGLAGRALDKDDQGVGYGDEQDTRGEKETAIKRSQPKSCAPPAQVGAKSHDVEPSRPFHGQLETR
jgi:hypothetical protein